MTTQTLNNILQKAYFGKRLNLEQGISLYDVPLLELGKIADKCRERKHPKGIVTFVIDRNISYTNVCISKCRFCAYYKSPEDDDKFLLSNEQILEKIDELVKLGGTQIMLQGGLHPELKLDYYIKLITDIKSVFDVHLHSFSPAEIVHISNNSNLSIEDTLKKLKDAGFDSLPGGGAEILVDRVRDIVSPHKINSEKWLEVMEIAHKAGLHTTATMVFGMVETIEERIKHMLKVRDLQDKTGGFKAFIPWSFSPHNTQMSKVKMTGGDDYLKTLAISRIMLDNIEHIHSGWVTEGPKLAQVALSFGANDLGGILMEESVISATGVCHNQSIDKIVHLIKSAGKIPAQRNSRYEILKKF